MKRWKGRRLSAAIWLAIAMPMLGASSATRAVESYLTDFNNLYGTAFTVLDDCMVCHLDPGGGARNGYGTDFANEKLSNDTFGVQSALTAIEDFDSDGDGILNLAEIMNLTFPGDCTDPDPAACPDDPGTVPPGTITEGPTMMACYKWDKFPYERFALSIKRYGGLVTAEPRNDFIESQLQTNHGVHGKHVGACGPKTIGLADGTFLKAKEIGSHLAIQTLASRGDGGLGGDDWCRSVVLDCISEEDVQVPKEFKCRSRNEFDVYHGKSQLKLVQNPAEDPLCNAFEDSGDAGNIEWRRASGFDYHRGGRNDD